MSIGELIALLKDFDPKSDVIIVTENGDVPIMEDCFYVSDNNGHAQLEAESFALKSIERDIQGDNDSEGGN